METRRRGPRPCCAPPTATWPGCGRSATATASSSVLDEIMVGFGRTGRWFASEHWDVTPDLICFAKGVTSG
ncbi:aminotransferase class III-fold pyridoxal phosphate-dependent enzyme, partial [Streptomyces virginiae]|uniref:aminotransferase class III-fold pyridoxal phosphate-dependent enzyme n=1 Tax=Streptomyces virginiae TaxID=1961 RepID=UPI0035714FC4